MIRKGVRARVRKAVLDAHGWICHYCGERASEADHILPPVHDGNDHPSNLIAACASCNASKADKLLPPDKLKRALDAAAEALEKVLTVIPDPPVEVQFYATNSTRKTMALPDTLWEAIDEYRHDNRIPSEIEAIRHILESALQMPATYMEEAT